MRTFVSSLVVAAALACAPSVFAGEPAWHFKPGQTYTYECSSEFHYVQFNAPTRTRTNGGMTSERTGTEDPQWETVTLSATVLNVGDDGAARLEFTVAAVRIETRFDSSGDHAEWDSSKSKQTEFAGFKDYEAMVGYTFQAIVGADGSIREMKNNAWPKGDTTGTKSTEKTKRENRAADATHNPTPAESWINLIFTLTPQGGEEWTPTIHLPNEEKLTSKADGTETIGKYPCVKARIKSTDKERGIKPGDVKVEGAADLAKYAAAMIEATQKKGATWFSRANGCMVKVELEAAAEDANRVSRTSTTMKWDVVLKDRGMKELAPKVNDEPSSAKDEPTK